MEPEDPELDVFGVSDVLDIGQGEPLFSNFSFEDWALLRLRTELYLLLQFFTQDVKDEERAAIHVDNLAFYYSRYFRKNLNTQAFGVEKMQDLLAFFKDTALLGPRLELKAQLPAELDCFDLFLKITEDQRRERQLQIDLGDESAVLKFNESLLSAAAGSFSGASGKGGLKGNSKMQPGKGYDPSKGYEANKGFEAKGQGYAQSFNAKGNSKQYDKGQNLGAKGSCGFKGDAMNAKGFKGGQFKGKPGFEKGQRPQW
mmetsp:Transcript_66133/g.155711  ORF Transcript_66133/g.155711 Transcript_66133/m.155711 type:complete len:257 (-) Transcript_66133:67-837(-)